ncbi:glycoside hydrolase family 30 protein [Oscillospiraceae bacterium HV4-5-C5C]|nr:glycoside hydrolase family 30 protein [Oscillospiraceae bacterium HV4-5-C5C]
MSASTKLQVIRVIETDLNQGKRLAEQKSLTVRDDQPGSNGQEGQLLNIYEQVQYQEILGFGGAFTEASALNFAQLDPKNQALLMEAYFDPELGLGYNFCRSTINSCDFSADFYTYDDTEDDYNLSDFNIEHDRQAIIPMIKAARENNEDLRLFCSPWSPPAWMKTNHRMDHGGSLRPECRDVWARYTARFIQAYQAEGVPIWGVTVQNEAKAAQGWESCVYSAGEERDFVTGFLKPAYEQAGLGDVKVFFWDHNKERVVERGLETLCNERSRAAFDGVAVHWYSGDHFTALDVFHRLYPEKIIIASEQCTHAEPDIPYASGEAYAHDILGNLNNWAAAWTDWNMLLDDQGGPDHWKDWQEANPEAWEAWRQTPLKTEAEIWVGEAPVMLDRRSQTLSFSSSYYYLGHFSKYIQRSARRIGSSCYSPLLETAAFMNPDGSVTAIVLNRSSQTLPLTLRWKKRLADYQVSPHSIVTFLL